MSGIRANLAQWVDFFGGSPFGRRGRKTIPSGPSPTHASPPVKSQSSSTEYISICYAIECIKTTLKILDELMDGPTVDPFLDMNEQVDMGMEFLQEHCSRLMDSLEVLRGSSETLQRSLQDSLDQLHSEISQISGEAYLNEDEALIIEKTSRKIIRVIEPFLLGNHIAGFFSMQNALGVTRKHSITQAIKDLPHAGAAYNCSSSNVKHQSCFKGTRATLLQEIGKWISISGRSQIYTLLGPSGIGKSTIAHTVAEKTDNIGYLGASFFFSRDDVERRSAKQLFTTIAFQLCTYDNDFAQVIGNVLHTERGKKAITKDAQDQLEILILEPLRDIMKSRARPVVLVLDGLDECDDQDVTIILEALSRFACSLPSFKIIVMAHPHLHLDPLIKEDFYLQKFEDKVLDSEIRLYLDHHLSQEMVSAHLPNLQQQWSAHDSEIEELFQAAKGLFIIASTAVRFILDETLCNPRAQMEALKSEGQISLDSLENLYTAILRHVIAPNSEYDIMECFRATTGAILAVQQPLPIGTLSHLVAPWSADDIDTLLKNLQSLIVLNGDRPRIHHKSFYDFLTNPGHCGDLDLHIVSSNQHTRIATRCFQIMNMHLKYNILDLGDPACFMENNAGLVAEGISRDLLHERFAPELQYACTYWANHLESANTEDVDLMAGLEIFANQHLLHWFEALSWIGGIDSAKRSLGIVCKLKKSTSPNPCVLLYEGLRFISGFYELIQQSALHTYHSALLFTPPDSPLYKLYSKEPFRNLWRLERGPERWDGLIAMLDQHDSVHHASFSEDSSRVASWTSKNLRLWDATSGAPMKTLKGDMVAFAEGFSTVALCQDGIATLREVMSNTIIATVKLPAEVLQMTLSFDGSRVAAGLSDGLVKLWDTKKSEPILGFKGYAHQLIFSPHDYNLAFLSGGDKAQLWNGFDGEFIANLNYRSEKPVKVEFSGNGSRLAFLTRKGDIYALTLWNSWNGELIGAAENVWYPLAISNDGSLLATGGEKNVQMWSDDGDNPLSLVKTLGIGEQLTNLAFSPSMLAIGSVDAVLLYDLENHATVSTLPFCQPYTLAFSPDGTRFAAGNYTGYIQLWDLPAIVASIPASKEQTRSVTALAISPDCSQFASGFKDGTVKLWYTDHASGQIATHQNHLQVITYLAFSSDGERLASGSWDKTVRLWESKTSAPLGTLHHAFHSAPISIAFSRDLLAAATLGSIILGNPKTLRPTGTLEEGAESLSFSSDGSLLASVRKQASSSRVAVWDVGKRTRIAVINMESSIRIKRLMFSPDHSRLAAQLRDGSFQIINVDTKRAKNTTCENLSWLPIPRWNGIPISPAYDSERGYHVLGQFSEQYARVPILLIPRNLSVSEFAIGSSLFAFGCADGRVFFVRSSID